jgi:hypothetical protein
MALQLEWSNETANAAIRVDRFGRNKIQKRSTAPLQPGLKIENRQMNGFLVGVPIEVDIPREAMVRQPSMATGRVRFGADDR